MHFSMVDKMNELLVSSNLGKSSSGGQCRAQKLVGAVEIRSSYQPTVTAVSSRCCFPAPSAVAPVV